MKTAFIIFDGMTALDFIGAASLDLGLHVVQRLSGTEARERVARQMDYPYRPKA